MKFTAVSMAKTGMVFNSYNKNQFADLTTEKLSGFGVSCSKSAVHLLQVLLRKVDCIFVAENSKINNNPLTN